MRASTVVAAALVSAALAAPEIDAARYAVTEVYNKGAALNPDGLPATAYLRPLDISADGAGNLYVLGGSPIQVLKIGPDGIVRRIGGGGTLAPATGLRATDVSILGAANQHLAADKAGNVYVSDRFRHQVYRFGADGLVTMIAGTGTRGFSGDGGPGPAAELNTPSDVAVDDAGNLYIADSLNRRVRRVAPDGTIQTVAGNGESVKSGDGGPATAAGLGGTWPLAVSSDGHLYFYDVTNPNSRLASIRRVNLTSGVIETFAGGVNPFGLGSTCKNDGVAPTAACFEELNGLAAGPDGALYFGERRLNGLTTRIRKVSGGTVSTVAGGNQHGISGDGGPAQAAFFSDVRALCSDLAGSLWLLDHLVVRKISGGRIETVAGAHSGPAIGEGGPLASSQLREIVAVTRDAQGNFCFADQHTHSVYRTAPDLSNLTRVAGTGFPGNGGDNGAAASSPLWDPIDVEADQAGNIYIADTSNGRVRKVTPNGQMTAVAGSDHPEPFFSEGMPARRADVWPVNLRLRNSGDLYIFTMDNQILRLAPGGTLHRYAGNGTYGYGGDGGPAVQAQFRNPFGIDFDVEGNGYVADLNNHRIRRIAANGTVTTVAGTGESGYSGEGGPATAAKLLRPSDVRVDAAGNILFFDAGNHRVRRINRDGTIQTVCGGGTGFENQWEATGIQMWGESTYPGSLHSDADGVLWVNDNARVMRLDPAQIFRNWVFNAASFVFGPVAPGEIITFYGEDIGPATLTKAAYSAGGQLDRTVAGTQVLFDGQPGPLVYVSKTVNSAVVPYSASGSVRMEVVVNGQRTNAINLTVAPSMPGVFTYSGGAGQIVAVNQDLKFNGAPEPAARGQWVTVFLTGQGVTTPVIGDGVLPSGPQWPAAAGGVSIKVGGVDVPPGDIWNGLIYQGVLQVNFRVPESAPAGGAAPLVVSVGEASSQAPATLAPGHFAKGTDCSVHFALRALGRYLRGFSGMPARMKPSCRSRQASRCLSDQPRFAITAYSPRR